VSKIGFKAHKHKCATFVRRQGEGATLASNMGANMAPDTLANICCEINLAGHLAPDASTIWNILKLPSSKPIPGETKV
jgi:hypothetical protein